LCEFFSIKLKKGGGFR